MEEIVLKSEFQPNGDILLFYVDEDGNNAQGVVTAAHDYQEIDQSDEVQLSNEDTYVLDIKPDAVESESDMDVTHEEKEESIDQNWTDEENHRLLSFYVDNKQTFQSGVAKQHLWTVICNTVLNTKNAESCETQFQLLKNKYTQMRVENKITENLPFFKLCHKAFFDDENVNEMVKKASTYSLVKATLEEPVNSIKNVIITKNISNRTSKPTTSNENIEVTQMLNLYLKYKNAYKNEHFTKGLWDLIAVEMGQEDSEHLQRRFYNYKNHYIRMLDKRSTDGPNSVMWPYMSYFDQIYQNDEDFQKRYGIRTDKRTVDVNNLTSKCSVQQVSVWSDPEKIVLAKYYFDSFHEFMDPTIPDNFLWTEVGRLLDRKPEECKAKMAELKSEHLQKYIEGNYEILKRTTLAILIDSVICKEVKWELSKPIIKDLEFWETEEVDALVQFFYDSIQMFKDRVCYFVCWAAVAVKLKSHIQSCRRQWQNLVTLYKTILEEKKENPDMQIDWRYIDLFDRIFDYGMDTNLLEGYQFEFAENNATSNVLSKKINDSNVVIDLSDDEEYDERGFSKCSKRYTGDPKAFKILEFYQKNKEKFSSNRRKQALWEQLSKQIGISPAECAHRFRNFKQVYTSYIQREINKPEMPILWPYYGLCKKVFGYRAIKAKLKNEHRDSDDSEDWTPKEIKALINYLDKRFDNINAQENTKSKWTDLSNEIGKTEFACNDKFLELRKSYRKLKTMKTKDPLFKVSWKYYNMLNEIYSKQSDLKQDEKGLPELPEDDDYQCIIVLPEGEELTDFSTAQFIIEDPKDLTSQEEVKSKTVTYWTFKAKRQLLLLYMKYVKAHKNEKIVSADMWREIALGLQSKSAFSARKMFAKLKSRYLRQNNEDCTKETQKLSPLWKRILAMKPKFVKIFKNDADSKGKVYKDVVLPDSKVQEALQYYMESLDEFLNPQFDKKFLWTELAKRVDLPFVKIYHKIHYLKNNYDLEANIVTEKTPFDDILREILVKEKYFKDNFVNEADPKYVNDDSPWTDDEIEQLLIWYLSKLDQFKNPKYLRSYLWRDASNVLQKSAMSCSKKMSEIRTQYRTMVKENQEELNTWRFHSLCQKIYGTGKKNSLISPN